MSSDRHRAPAPSLAAPATDRRTRVRPSPRSSPAIRSRWTPESVQETNPVPRRAVIAVIGTVLALALLLSFKTPDAIPSVAGGLRGSGSDASPTRPATAFGGAASSAPAAPATASGTSAQTGRTGAPRQVSLPTSNPTHAIGAPQATAPPPTATPHGASGDVVGPVEDTPYGGVQVEVKANGGKILEVIAVQLPGDRRRSAQISQYVAPILHDEALQAQSAQIDLISGATWTSGAYQASLQGALDKLVRG